jgi:tRNA threonylcarbamoyladenosine biosynthesis protein TsaB
LPDVRVLAFDTATPSTVVGLLDTESGAFFEARHDPATGARPEHAPRLLPLVDRVLGEAAGGEGDVAAAWNGVDRIGVGTGPGSFTGLRIGIATARALAQARGLPLVGVGTLEVIARGAAQHHSGTILAILDARRGEAFAAAWRDGERLLAPTALRPEALAERAGTLPQPLLAAGDGSVRFREQLKAAGAEVPDDSSPLHRVAARTLCETVAEAVEEPPGTVLPDYLRLPDAEIAYRKRSPSR